MNHLTPTGAAEMPEALLNIAREIEALKRECGMDPESPVAIQNGRYMAISHKVRNLAAMLSAAQTELAAMRAGGEPVAEMVPYHTPSGKRVAVISRFQHLPIGTKLYAHHQPAAQDAERKPLTDEQVSLAFRRGIGQWMTPGSAFAAGVRSAERAHGIAAQQGDSHD